MLNVCIYRNVSFSYSLFCFLVGFFFVCLVPDDQSLKVYRAEANWAMMRFSDALTDLDYLCCLRPNWTEVRDACGLDSLGKTHMLLFAFIVSFSAQQ